MTIQFCFKGCADNNSFQEKNVRTTSEPKHTKVFEIEEVLKTDNTEDEDKSENLTPRKNGKIFQIQTKKLLNKC